MNLLNHFNQYRAEIIMGLLFIVAVGGAAWFVFDTLHNMVYEGSL